MVSDSFPFICLFHGATTNTPQEPASSFAYMLLWSTHDSIHSSLRGYRLRCCTGDFRLYRPSPGYRLTRQYQEDILYRPPRVLVYPFLRPQSKQQGPPTDSRVLSGPEDHLSQPASRHSRFLLGWQMGGRALLCARPRHTSCC